MGYPLPEAGALGIFGIGVQRIPIGTQAGKPHDVAFGYGARTGLAFISQGKRLIRFGYYPGRLLAAVVFCRFIVSGASPPPGSPSLR